MYIEYMLYALYASIQYSLYINKHISIYKHSQKKLFLLNRSGLGRLCLFDWVKSNRLPDILRRYVLQLSLWVILPIFLH